MKTMNPHLIAGILVMLGCAALAPLGQAADGERPVRVLLVTGGHEYETNQFLQVFRDNPAITVTPVTHPDAQRWFAADRAGQWDVAVLYDMWQPIDEGTRANLVARLKEGKGLVVTHHAIANYQAWPEYEKILGARYYLEPTVRDGVRKERSKWLHDVQFKVRVTDRNHPVTRGLADFEIHDETYILFDVHADVTVLLTTDAPTSQPTLAWAKTYDAARVVYLQLGHDHLAYENPQYRRLLANAIRWTGRRD
jgi:uncharacterized protein